MSSLVIDTNMLICIAAFIFLVVVVFMALIIVRDKKSNVEEISELEEIEELEKELGIKGEHMDIIEEKDNKSELEKVLEKMQKNLETKPEEVVEKFEKEQEEKAIISYQELVKSLKKGNVENTIETSIEEKELKDSRPELKQIVDSIKNPVISNIKETSKKFKNTEFISPVFGKMEEHLEDKRRSYEEPIEKFDEIYESYNLNDYLNEFKTDSNIRIDSLEQTLDLGPITAEIKKNEEFLQALKEFRENL